MSVQLRPGRPTDAPRLHELHTVSVRTLCAPSYPPEIIDGWLKDRHPDGYLPGIESGALFVAEANAAIVGFGEAAAGVIFALYVDPAVARRGIGSTLLRRALELARRNHAGAINVEATLNAGRFYEKHGFRELDRCTTRRGRTDVPIIWMELRSDRETQTAPPPQQP